MSVLRGVLLGLLLVLANGFFVAVEFALLAARRVRVESLAADGRFGARAALAGMRTLNLQLAASQLGITVMSLLLGWLVEPVVGGAVEQLFGLSPLPEGVSTGLGLAVALTLVALVHMVLGEMIPKSIALAAPERTVMALAPVHRLVSLLVRPVVVVLYATARAGTRLLGVDPTDELVEAHTPQELAVVLEAAHSGGELTAEELERLSGAMEFGARSVAEVMTPARELVVVPHGATVAEAETLFLRSGHSRILVQAPDGDVTGFLHVKDVIGLDPAVRDDPLPVTLVRQASHVDGAAVLDEVLADILRVRRHLAVVEHRPGGTVRPSLLGLVTVEDLVEEIFGDILDETDRPED
ncbi:MAG: hemolysin family protein [Actinomycetes bacterium]